MPLLILTGAALVLLTITSVVHDRLPRWFFAMYAAAAGLGTVIAAIPVWLRVTDDDRGPYATIEGAFGVDGF